MPRWSRNFMVRLRPHGVKSPWVLALIPLLAGAALACAHPVFQAGPLGAVEFPPGEPIHIRSLGSLTGASDLAIHPGWYSFTPPQWPTFPRH